MLSGQAHAAIEAVESLIQYKFSNPDLLWEALNTTPDRKRLAIIGDLVLSLALAEDWYKSGTNRGEFPCFETCEYGH